MATLATDDFDRADEDPIASPWAKPSGLNALQIASNVVGAATANSDCAAYYSTVSWPDDQYSEVRIATVGGADGGPAVRLSTASDGYFVTAFTGSVISLYKIVSGGFSDIGGAEASYNVNDIIRIEAQGTTIRVLQNGSTIITVTDSSIASGNAGVFLFDGSIRVDDWAGGDFSAGDTLMGQVLT